MRAASLFNSRLELGCLEGPLLRAFVILPDSLLSCHGPGPTNGEPGRESSLWEKTGASADGRDPRFETSSRSVSIGSHVIRHFAILSGW